MRGEVKVLLTCLLAGFLLVSCVPFPAAQETSAIPMVVTPTPTPVATTATIIRLEADGSGDYSTLTEAVQRAPSGATISLGPGTYRLAEPLTISKSLRLVGSGMDQTEIVTDAGAYVVSINSDEPFVAEGITFRHEGKAIAEVVVHGRNVTLSQCRLVGTALCGIQVSTRGQATLERNVCTGHEAVGMIYEGDGGGLVRQNECSGNGVGIQIGKQAQPALEENICTGNKMGGIAYSGRAGGIARQNDCSRNAIFGITVGEQAQPTLEENTCNDNTDDAFGIFYSDNAGGIARRNECARNYVGIAVAETASPTLENNDCHDNTKADIWDQRKQ